MGEFELIERFFRPAMPARQPAVQLGMGDDCALLQPAAGQQLAVSSDMLVEGRHFFANVDPEALGHKALAVNLSDLAAMGAEPLGFTLAIALPPDRAQDVAWQTTWLAPFARGLHTLAAAHTCPLIGGDTTAGPLTLSLTVLGQIPPGQALRRDAACPGDDLWVSGTLGDARLALGALRGEWALPAPTLAVARTRLERPSPRIALGMALRGIAHSAIDISDGLAGDLGHILRASGTGACIHAHTARRCLLSAWPGGLNHQGQPLSRLSLALNGGDDYELAFTAPPEARPAILAAACQSATLVRRIGRIEPAPGLRVLERNGQLLDWQASGFDHFA